MKAIYHLSKQVEDIYCESEKMFSTYQKSTHLNCLKDCGKCCLGKEVSSTLLEMIPSALDLLSKGLAQQYLEKLESSNELECFFYIRTSPDGSKGYCSNYEFRPSVCRSFGVAATKDKYGQKSASICREIRSSYSSQLLNIDLTNAPVIGDYARRISSLDSTYGTTIYPINTALKMALEKVLFLSQFGN